MVKAIYKVKLARTNVLAAFPALRSASRARVLSRALEPGLLYVGVIYNFRVNIRLDYFSGRR